MRGDDREFGNHRVKLIELGDNFVGASGIVVAVAQEQGFSDAIFEAAFLIDGIADVEQAVMRIEVHEDADAAGSVAAQGHNHD